MWRKKGFFTKIGKTRIVPIGLKILLIFICLILLSNIATNIISIQLSQRQIITLNNTIMVEQLKELYNNSSNQFQIYSYSQKRDECLQSIGQVAKTGFSNENSVAMGVEKDGNIIFFSSNNELLNWNIFSDAESLAKINENFEKIIEEGSISFTTDDGDFFGHNVRLPIFWIFSKLNVCRGFLSEIDTTLHNIYTGTGNLCQVGILPMIFSEKTAFSIICTEL
jgi:hypothetical protein